MLWPPEEPRVAEEEVVEARRHVESCPRCQEFLRADRFLRERMASLELPSAPPELRERVFQALALERARRSDEETTERGDPGRDDRDDTSVLVSRGAVSPVRKLAVAAAVVALFGSAWHFGGGLLPVAGPTVSTPYNVQEEPYHTPVEHFVRAAVQERTIDSSDPDAVARFFSRELGLHLRPQEFEGFRLVGAEVCVLEDKRGGVLIYERNGKRLYHYVLNHPEVVPRELRPTSARPLRMAGTEPIGAVLWSHGSYDEALVAPLPSDELMDLASQATPTD